MCLILTTQEAEIIKIKVGSQSGKTVWRAKSGGEGAGGVVQGEGPEFKAQYHNKKTNKKTKKVL
jgi:hypothetical protein